MRKAWANIDVLLTQRHDELPKLVETCKRYMAVRAGDARARDAGALRGVQGAGPRRRRRGRRGRGPAARRASAACSRVAENYPDLKADNGFRHLQTRISELEEAIADRRELYNESVNLNNIRIQTFPDLLVARMFEFKPAQLLEFTEEQKRDVDLGKLFG